MKKRNVFLLLGGIVSLAWIPFYMYDWKIAGSVMLVMWANNLVNNADK